MTGHGRIRAALVALSTIAPSSLAAPVLQQGTPCDPARLDQAAEVDPSRAYGPRQGRCEGQYKRPYADDDDPREAFLVALFARPATFEIDGLKPLAVSWPAIDVAVATSIHLTAQSKCPNVYYQMDAEVPTDAGFTWPTEILARVGVAPKDLALLGWIRPTADSPLPEVYVPLVISTVDPPSAPGAVDAAPGPASEPSDASLYPIHVEFRVRRDVYAATVDLWLREGDTFASYERNKFVLPQPTERQGVWSLDCALKKTKGIHRIDLNLELQGGVPYSLQFYCIVAGQTAADAGEAVKRDESIRGDEKR